MTLTPMPKERRVCEMDRDDGVLHVRILGITYRNGDFFMTYPLLVAETRNMVTGFTGISPSTIRFGPRRPTIDIHWSHGHIICVVEICFIAAADR